jgi:hypothetical protein
MPSDVAWDNPHIECEVWEITDTCIQGRNESVHHASAPVHVASNADWIRDRIVHSVDDGRQLWNHSREFFPSLEYCSTVEAQMIDLPSASLACIMRGLFQLNSFCLVWKTGAFDPKLVGCSVSPESAQTLEMYGPERTFLCPDGLTRTFNWHTKLGRWRIYFDPVHGPGRLIVGYVGGHLRAASFG